MTIRPFIRDACFSPEALQAMSLAYDNARALIKESDPQSCEALAVRIVTLASCGELDPGKLTAAAVESFSVWSNGKPPVGPSLVPDNSGADRLQPSQR